MTKSELKGLIRTILKEELLREADEPSYQYSFYFAGTKLEEDQFKQKLILTIKTLKSMTNTAAIPEAVDVIVSGLKEGAEIKGTSVFELAGKTIIVKAKKAAAAATTAVETKPTTNETTEPEDAAAN